jgi:autotransporter-associated beta strand protein
MTVVNTPTMNVTGAVVLNGGGISGTGTLTLQSPAGIPTINSLLGGGITCTINGTQGLAYTGTNPLLLYGSNTYTGSTIIYGPDLKIVDDSCLGAVPATPTPSSVILDGGTLELVGSFALNANRGIYVRSAGGTLNINGGGQTITYGGVIDGEGQFNVVAPGVLVLSGVSTQTGLIRIVNSTIRLSGGNDRLRTTNDLDISTGRFDLGGFSQTVDELSGAGTVTSSVGGTSVLTLGNNNGSNMFSGAIENGSGTVALTKVGTGTQTLGGVNTYTGNTLVTGGVLLVSSSLANNGSDKVFVARDGDGVFGDAVGDAAIARNVLAGGSYAGLGVAVAEVGVGEKASTADILAGTNLSGSSETVSMAWRTITQAEWTNPGLISDVVRLAGMTLTGTSQTSPFVFQMSYDPSLLPGGAANEGTWASEKKIYLAWLDPADGRWENAVQGNIGTNSDTFHLGAWPDGDMTLGDWGVDTTSHTVWAVLDHNSDFAVVPEPGTWTLLGAGVVGLIGWAWRRQRKTV